MKIDHHFHLEEGPYSIRWLMRTTQAIVNADPNMKNHLEIHSLDWMRDLLGALNHRVQKGSYSDEWLDQYIRLGEEQGIGHFGIVDHLYRFTEFRSYYERYMVLDSSQTGTMQRYWLDRVCTESIEGYFELVRRFQKKGTPISLGVEADFFPGCESELEELLAPYEFDFVIGSVHFIDGWGFDNPELQHRFEELELLDLYTQFFDHVIGAARSGLFQIIAHLDNIKVFNYRPDEELLIPLYNRVAKALKDADVATEINMGLAYRYPVKEMCPSPLFLETLHKNGVPITTSSDSHFPDDLGTMIEDAVEQAVQVGYKEIVYFKNKKRYSVDI
ncbi:histidinol phosphate phosphatase domain-containing protein [Aquibacillus halophilus]|uniref:Histidinol-phosphatase n=1 Tax=Aquibacillus halophilus TaxID=930132 RepID=A0A6A8D6A2_9BACI|nr:PHP domain-containing protein [Aquibacillus halophilus]MRH41134.1 histidinol phosphate phosphatase domain-containing protein [Aquibacillus halophilus]